MEGVVLLLVLVVLVVLVMAIMATQGMQELRETQELQEVQGLQLQVYVKLFLVAMVATVEMVGQGRLLQEMEAVALQTVEQQEMALGLEVRAVLGGFAG